MTWAIKLSPLLYQSSPAEISSSNNSAHQLSNDKEHYTVEKAEMPRTSVSRKLSCRKLPVCIFPYTTGLKRNKFQLAYFISVCAEPFQSPSWGGQYFNHCMRALLPPDSSIMLADIHISVKHRFPKVRDVVRVLRTIFKSERVCALFNQWGYSSGSLRWRKRILYENLPSFSCKLFRIAENGIQRLALAALRRFLGY